MGALEAQGENMGREAKVREVREVDVKDLLSLGRVVMERKALDKILREHQSDLNPEQKLSTWKRLMEVQGLRYGEGQQALGI